MNTTKSSSSNKPRVFTYGCSITQHIWPTWADIVLHSARISGYSVFNAGLSGIGNTGIKRSVIQTHEKYRLNEEDLLLVMWTSFLREDRLSDFHSHEDPATQRHTKGSRGFRHTQSGNVLNSPFYTKEFIRNYFNIEHYIINSISEISIVRKAFNLLFEGHFSIGEGLNAKDNLNDSRQHLRTHSKSVYAMLMNDLKLPNPWHIGYKYRDNPPYSPYYAVDGHPVPAEALEYVQNTIEPLLPFPIHDATIRWVNTWNHLLQEQCHEKWVRPKQDWQQLMSDKMTRHNLTSGVTTSKQIWGGDHADEKDSDKVDDEVDVAAIMKTFINNSAENS